MEETTKSQPSNWSDIIIGVSLTILGLGLAVLVVGWTLSYSLNSYSERKYEICVRANTPEERKDGVFYNYRANCFDKVYNNN